MNTTKFTVYQCTIRMTWQGSMLWKDAMSTCKKRLILISVQWVGGSIKMRDKVEMSSRQLLKTAAQTHFKSWKLLTSTILAAVHTWEVYRHFSLLPESSFCAVPLFLSVDTINFKFEESLYSWHRILQLKNQVYTFNGG